MIVRCFVKSELDATSRENSVNAVFFAGRTEGKLTESHQPSNHKWGRRTKGWTGRCSRFVQGYLNGDILGCGLALLATRCGVRHYGLAVYGRVDVRVECKDVGKARSNFWLVAKRDPCVITADLDCLHSQPKQQSTWAIISPSVHLLVILT